MPVSWASSNAKAPFVEAQTNSTPSLGLSLYEFLPSLFLRVQAALGVLGVSSPFLAISGLVNQNALISVHFVTTSHIMSSFIPFPNKHKFLM